MPFDLDIKHETLNYVGKFVRPTFELWGRGGPIIEHLYDALNPFGLSLANFQVTGNGPTVADPVITANIAGVGHLKFSFDKIEFSISRFTTDLFQALPSILQNFSAWISESVPHFGYASHSFSYFAHAFVKDATPEEVLKNMNGRSLSSAGICVGNGAIFNYSLPEKNWEIQFIADKSRQLAGGIFLNLSITINEGEQTFEEILGEGREYLKNVLLELELRLPELDEQ